MKKIITLIFSLSFALSLLTACGSESQTDTQNESSKSEEQSESPQAGAQYINTFIASDPSTLDCARFLGVVDRVILHSITEPLTRIQDGIVTAAGAESWDVSDDGLIYTFHLRENYWEDGSKLQHRITPTRCSVRLILPMHGVLPVIFSAL